MNEIMRKSTIIIQNTDCVLKLFFEFSHVKNCNFKHKGGNRKALELE